MTKNYNTKEGEVDPRRSERREKKKVHTFWFEIQPDENLHDLLFKCIVRQEAYFCKVHWVQGVVLLQRQSQPSFASCRIRDTHTHTLLLLERRGALSSSDE